MTGRLALSLWQPWASFVVEGVKTIETRSWSTRHRGPLLIHAAQPRSASSIPSDVLELAIARWGERWLRAVPFGAVVGEVELVDVVPAASVVGSLDSREVALGNFEGARFAWILRNPRAWTVPLPYAGRQRLFNVDAERARAFELRLGEVVPSWYVGEVPKNAGLEARAPELRP